MLQLNIIYVKYECLLNHAPLILHYIDVESKFHLRRFQIIHERKTTFWDDEMMRDGESNAERNVQKDGWLYDQEERKQKKKQRKIN